MYRLGTEFEAENSYSPNFELKGLDVEEEEGAMGVTLPVSQAVTLPSKEESLALGTQASFDGRSPPWAAFDFSSQDLGPSTQTEVMISDDDVEDNEIKERNNEPEVKQEVLVLSCLLCLTDKVISKHLLPNPRSTLQLSHHPQVTNAPMSQAVQLLQNLEEE